jgi:hypothetical protein
MIEFLKNALLMGHESGSSGDDPNLVWPKSSAGPKNIRAARVLTPWPFVIVATEYFDAEPVRSGYPQGVTWSVWFGLRFRIDGHPLRSVRWFAGYGEIEPFAQAHHLEFEFWAGNPKRGDENARPLSAPVTSTLGQIETFNPPPKWRAGERVVMRARNTAPSNYFGPRKNRVEVPTPLAAHAIMTSSAGESWAWNLQLPAFTSGDRQRPEGFFDAFTIDPEPDGSVNPEGPRTTARVDMQVDRVQWVMAPVGPTHIIRFAKNEEPEWTA